MLKLIDRYFVHKDPRGQLEGLINSGTWEEMNLISSLPDIVRGNHYHKETVELFIILDGRISITLQDVKDGILVGSESTTEVGGGDVFQIDPLINHTFSIVEEARWINVLSRRIDPQAPDIHTVE